MSSENPKSSEKQLRRERQTLYFLYHLFLLPSNNNKYQYENSWKITNRIDRVCPCEGQVIGRYGYPLVTG